MTGIAMQELPLASRGQILASWRCFDGTLEVQRARLFL
jgi:hypothetical protein